MDTMQYTHLYRSPLGTITLAADSEGLTGLWFEGQKYFAATLDAQHEETMLPIFEQTRRWLDNYFGGNDPGPTPPLHLQGSPFRLAVWEILRQIPFGKTITYGEIAREIARRQGSKTVPAQAVGGAVGHQSRQHHRSLPSGRGEQRQPDGLCGRHRAEGTAPRPRKSGYDGAVRSAKRHSPVKAETAGAPSYRRA